MSKNLLIAASIIALTAPVAASADVTFEGAVTLGYSFGSFSVGGADQDVNTLSLRMDSVVTFSQQFDMGLKLGLHGYDIDNVSTNVTVTDFAIAPRYTLNNGLILGAYYEIAKASISGASLNPDLQSYGLSIGKDSATWGVEGFIGASDSNVFSSLGTNVDIMDVGVRGSYRGVENLTVGGHFIYTEADIKAASTKVKLYSLGVAADYLITDQWSVYGGVSRVWADENSVPIDAASTTGSIGVGYAFGGGSTFMPITASLELVANDISIKQPGSGSAKFDEIRIGLTIPLGNKGRTVPLNSATHNIIDGGHSAISTLLGVY